MRENTTNLGLVKPDKTDQYNVADFNDNMQKIDDFAGLTPPRALTADKLTVGRNINGVTFDGTKNVITGIGLHSMTETYSSTNAVYDFGESNNLALFRSKQNDNTGHATSEGDWWEEVSLGGGINDKITNCILSAPNSIATYSGTTVTVQEGTNYLFPNGRNSNNSVKNVNFSLASAATGTITGSTSATYCVFVTSELDLIFANNINYFITNTQPTALNDATTAGVWFNPQTNLMYQCAATASTPSWSTFEGAICATLTYNGSTITAFNPIYPVELLKRSDKAEITGWGVPDYSAAVTQPVGTYTAEYDCHIIVSTINWHNYPTANVEILNNDGEMITIFFNSGINASQSGVSASATISKGTKYRTSGIGTVTVSVIPLIGVNQ